MVDRKLRQAKEEISRIFSRQAREIMEEARRLEREGRMDVAKRLEAKARALAEEARRFPFPAEFFKAKLEIPPLKKAAEDLERRAREFMDKGWERRAQELRERLGRLEGMIREKTRVLEKAVGEMARKMDELRRAGEEMIRQGDFLRAEKFRTQAEILDRMLSMLSPPPPPPEEELRAVEERVQRLFELAEDAERMGEKEVADRIREKAESLKAELEKERQRRAAEEELRKERGGPPPRGEKEELLEREIRELREEIRRLREEMKRLKRDRGRETPPPPPIRRL